MCLHPSHRWKSEDTIAWLRQCPTPSKLRLETLYTMDSNRMRLMILQLLPCPQGGLCTSADAVAKRYRPWPKGLRTDSLPWFDSPLVQGASRLQQIKLKSQRPGHTGRKALATQKKGRFVYFTGSRASNDPPPGL